MSHGYHRLLCVTALAYDCGCAPEFVDHTSLVDAPRVLAVRAEPAEAKPDVQVHYQALVAVPSDSSIPTPAWSYCTAAKSLSENNSVAGDCLTTAARKSLGTGPNITAKLPAEACRVFGPEAPPGAVRARDPDITGGYFQPLVIILNEQPALHLQRLSCNLANAPAEIAAAFAAEYTPNQNPLLSDVFVNLNHKSIEVGNVPPSTELSLTAVFDPNSRETYRYFDLEQQTLVNKRETLRVSWHADSGTWAQPFTEPNHDNTNQSTNTWLTPARADEVRLWIVLRDSRGGVDFRRLDFTVTE